MALFFDKEWFDAALAARGLPRAVLAEALGLDDAEISDVWKDQRELSAHQVSLIAALLAVPAEEVASRAGVSTPVPRAAPTGPAASAAAIADLSARLERVERELAAIKDLLRDGGRGGR